jgi:hypothetical protein
MKRNPLFEQAAKDRHLEARLVCLVCGSIVSTYNANASVVAVRPEAAKWDWWAACDNAHCENAQGEGYFQGSPRWAADRGCELDGIEAVVLVAGLNRRAADKIEEIRLRWLRHIICNIPEPVWLDAVQAAREEMSRSSTP